MKKIQYVKNTKKGEGGVKVVHVVFRGVPKMFMSVHKGGGGCQKSPKSCSRSL